MCHTPGIGGYRIFISVCNCGSEKATRRAVLEGWSTALINALGSWEKLILRSHPGNLIHLDCHEASVLLLLTGEESAVRGAVLDDAAVGDAAATEVRRGELLQEAALALAQKVTDHNHARRLAHLMVEKMKIKQEERNIRVNENTSKIK